MPEIPHPGRSRRKTDDPARRQHARARARDGCRGLSELFEFRIEAVSTEANLDFGLGARSRLDGQARERRKRVQVLQRRDDRSLLGGRRGGIFRYQLVLRPWLWLLTRTSDCRIFPSMTPKDIIKQVFTDRGFTDFRDEAKRVVSDAGILCPISRDRLQLRLPLDGRVRDLLFLRAFRWQAHPGARERQIQSRSGPGLASIPFIPVETGRPARRAARRVLVARPARADRPIRAQRLRLQQAAHQPSRRRRQTGRLRARPRWKYSTTPATTTIAARERRSRR